VAGLRRRGVLRRAPLRGAGFQGPLRGRETWSGCWPRGTPCWGLLALGLSVPVAIRRRVPVRSLVIVLAGCLVILIIGGQITRGPFLPLAVVLYLVASTCRRGIALAGLAGSLALLIAQGVVLHFNGQGSGNATGAALVLTIFWMVGYLVQQRRTHMAAVRDRAASDGRDPGTAADRPGTA